MRKISKKAVLPFSIALIYTIVTFYTDRFIFANFHVGKRYLTLKLLLCICLFIAFDFLQYFFSKCRRKDKKYCIWANRTILYFIIMLIGLLLVWPGLWQYDDIQMLLMAKNLQLFAWHHFLTSLFFILCLMLIPIPAGILLIQICLVSVVVGYILSTIETDFAIFDGLCTKKMSLFASVVLFLPFLLFPVVAHNLFPFRIVLYTYFEMSLVVFLLKIDFKQEHIGPVQAIGIVTLSIITASWRTEGVYYAALLPLLLFIFAKKSKRIVKMSSAMCMSICIIAGTIGISSYNNLLLGDGGKDYQLTGIFNPVVEIVRVINTDEIEEIRDALGAVLNINVIKENPDEPPPVLMNRYGLIREFTDEEYENFRVAAIKLFCRYPKEFLKTRWNMFLRTAGTEATDSNQRGVFRNSYKLFVTEDGEGKWLFYNDFIFSGRLTQPISMAIRQNTIRTICRLQDIDGYQTKQEAAIAWNLFPPFVFGLGCICLMMKKRRFLEALIIFLPFIRIPLVFITAPESNFFYYLGPYLWGYIILFAAAALFYERKTARRK